MIGQGRDPFGQGLRIGIGGQRRPARRAIGFDFGRAQIIGQRRPQSLLEPLFDLKAVHDLSTFGGVALHQTGQRRHLGAQGVQLALGGRAFRAHIGLAFLCLGAGSLGGEQGLIRACGQIDGGGFLHARVLEGKRCLFERAF